MMKKLSIFVTLFLFIVLTIFSFVPKLVFADGMMIKSDPYSDRWDYSNESNQQAFINYDDGLQKMIISVGLEGENSNGVVWLFPVPSDPNKVVIDVVKSLPQLGGEEISKKAKSNLDYSAKFLQMTQIYTIPLLMFFESGGVATLEISADINNPLGLNERGIEQDVVVYEHLEKEGITSEIITAKTAFGLYDYLKDRGLKIESGSILVLDNYIGKEYSFVASWISSPEKIISAQDIEDNLYIYFLNQSHYPSDYPKFFELVNNLKQKYPEFNQAFNPTEYLKSQQGKTVLQELTQTIQNDPSIIADAYNRNQINLSNQRGVFVTFPTKDIYFPMLPTSVYGSKIVPATIRVIGYVSPKIFQGIKSYTKTEYYIDSYASFAFAEDLEDFYSEQNKNIKYTKIEINAPSKFLTNDLWINKQPPLKTYYLSFIATHPVISTIILLILSSLVTGILAGLIVFKGLRKNIVKLGFIGLSNCLSIFGLLITTVFVCTKRKTEGIDTLLAEIKPRGYFWKRKFALILLLVDLPFLIIPVLIAVLTVLSGYGIFYATQLLTVVLIPLVVLAFALVIKKIKPEDKYLFEQLKANNYSSWSFQPKDKIKIAFIPIFSISFLVISWLIVKLVEITV